MTSGSATAPAALNQAGNSSDRTTGYLVLAGRILFSAIFILSGLSHFAPSTINFAAQQGVPMASVAVPLSGVIALVGGLSILLGFHARLGAWLIVLFLVPVTVIMHAFWTVKDPMMAQMQMAHFMKNVSLLGAALIISHFGTGPFSLDAHLARRRPLVV